MCFADTVAEQLQVGQRFKTYADLCQTLGVVPADGGTNKKKQKEKFKKYFSFERTPEGEIEITGISSFTPEIRGKYVEIVQKLILLLLSKDTTYPELDTRVIKKVEISKSLLHEIIGMFNPNYKQLPQDIMKKVRVATQNDSKITEQSEFYYSTNHKFNQITISALTSMRNRKLITWYSLVKYLKDGVYKVSTPEEAERIKFGEQYVLSHDFNLQPNQIYQLFKTDSWLEYRRTCEKFIKEYMEWDDYSWIYQIWLYPTELIREEYKKFPPSLTIDQLYKKYCLELNELVCDYFVSKGMKDKEKQEKAAYMTNYFLNIPNYLASHNESFEHYKANWIWFG